MAHLLTHGRSRRSVQPSPVQPAGHRQYPKSAWQMPTPLQSAGQLFLPCGGACTVHRSSGCRVQNLVTWLGAVKATCLSVQ